MISANTSLLEERLNSYSKMVIWELKFATIPPMVTLREIWKRELEPWNARIHHIPRNQNVRLRTETIVLVPAQVENACG